MRVIKVKILVFAYNRTLSKLLLVNCIVAILLLLLYPTYTNIIYRLSCRIFQIMIIHGNVKCDNQLSPVKHANYLHAILIHSILE